MPAYHSAFNEANLGARSLGNFAVLPLKTKIRGPALPAPTNPEDEDIVDEALNLFRANCFFRNFEIKGDADRVLVYLILYIQDCLQKLAKSPSQQQAAKDLATLAVQNFSIPGEPGFPLNALYQAPVSKADQEQMRLYLTQLRQELSNRIVDRVYVDGKPSKWWMCFSKRKFMNKSL